MILGKRCTRACGFCGVEKDRDGAHALPPDHMEPANVALTAREMGLKHVVITSVTRDDLPDCGAGQFASTIKAIRADSSSTFIEVLVPDFKGDEAALNTVLDAGPDIFNHNLETVPSLYCVVRPGADFSRSIELLRKAASSGATVKTGIMLGFGESPEEVRSLMNLVRDAGCEILTIGQYLRPTRDSLKVTEYVHPDIFKEYEEYGTEIGLKEVYSGPLIRSSYNADKVYGRISQN